MIVKYITKEVCSAKCGYGVLKDEIPIGTEYDIYPETIRGLTFICGGCGAQTEVIAVVAECKTRPMRAFLPIGIFDYERIK